MIAPEGIPSSTALICAALAGIPLTVWIVSMVQWTISGEVDGMTGFLGIASAAIIAGAIFKPPIPILSPVLCVVSYLTVMAYPTMKGLFNKAQLLQIELDILQNAYTGLHEKPDNVGLRLKVARLIYARGLVGPAIVLAENTLKSLPLGPFDAEQKMLNDWKQAAGNVTSFRSLPCLECGYANGAGEISCKKCGAPFLLHYAQGRWIGPDLGKRVIAGWSAMLLALIGTPFAYSYLDGPRLVVAFCGITVASGCLLLRALMPQKRRRI